ncbi:MAG TPA: hypothetical protein VIY86_12485, partial [Pirellulaceae bacterium]
NTQTSAAGADARPSPNAEREARGIRKELEQWHGRVVPEKIDSMFAALDHPDRYVRFAARIALEWQPVSLWEARALAPANSRTTLEAILALARCSTAVDIARAPKMLDTLLRLNWRDLDTNQRLAWIRACELVLIRTEASSQPGIGTALIPQLRSRFPDADPEVSQRLIRILAHLGDPEIAEPALRQMAEGLTQEWKIAHAYDVRELLPKFTAEQQRRYFTWFLETGDIRGGQSLRGFLDLIRKDAADRLGESQRIPLQELLDAPLVDPSPGPITPSLPVIKRYSVDEITALAATTDHETEFERSRAAFAKALCFKCHRVGLEGGSTGPDLTTATRRFSPAYLATSIVEPDREISDRYRTSTFVLDSGKVVTGRVANLNADLVMVVT